MKRMIARAVTTILLVGLARSYSPFGDGGLAVELLNVAVFLIAFLLLDRLITAKIR